MLYMCITITHICICAYPITQKPTEEGSYPSQPQRTGKHLGEREITDGTSQVPVLLTSGTSGPTSLLLVPGVLFAPIQLLASHGYTHFTVLYCAYNY